MRENRPSGSEGGGTEINRSSLPLSFAQYASCRVYSHVPSPKDSTFWTVLSTGVGEKTKRRDDAVMRGESLDDGACLRIVVHPKAPDVLPKLAAALRPRIG